MVELFTIGIALAALFVWIVMILPLWLSLKILGSDAGLLSTAFFSFVGVALLVLTKSYVSQSYGASTGAIAAYLAWVLTLKFAFDLSFIRALIATVLPIVLMAAVVFITGFGTAILILK